MCIYRRTFSMNINSKYFLRCRHFSKFNKLIWINWARIRKVMDISIRSLFTFKELTMGSSNSKKDVDSTGVINNNLVLKNDGNDDFSIQAFELTVILGLLLLLKFVKFCIYIYQMHKRNLKKGYNNRNKSNQNNANQDSPA